MRNIVDYDKKRYARDAYGNLYLKSQKHNKENKPCLCKVLCDLAVSVSHKPKDCEKYN